MDNDCAEDFDTKTHGPLFAILRKYSVVRFVKNVKSSFTKYLAAKCDFTWTQESEAALDKDSDLLKDLVAGRDGIARASKLSFWSWDAGSTHFFWRWQPEIQQDMRDDLNYLS